MITSLSRDDVARRLESELKATSSISPVWLLRTNLLVAIVLLPLPERAYIVASLDVPPSAKRRPFGLNLILRQLPVVFSVKKLRYTVET